MDRDSKIYKEAERRVREKASFYKHLYSYVIVNGVFLIMFAMRGKPFMPLSVAFFWGIGLMFHYLKVFGIPGSGVLSKEWEDKEIQREMEKMKGNQPGEEKAEKLELKELRKNYDDSEFV